ncbi:hypothetical protein KAS45_01155 [candidate division WOR-3 bacterium]|nr:hypothetical protein [candidate division WOR-3 bacterium]
MICMFFLLFLISYDSLPPLPDLSHLHLPEPVLWAQPVERSIAADGYLGEFRGFHLTTKFSNLEISGLYNQTNEWDSTETGKGYLSYMFRFPGIWFEPRLTAFRLLREDEYRLLTPGFDFIGFSSFAVIPATIDYYRWEINGESSSEADGTISLLFDKTRYLPCITVRGLYTDQRFKTILSGKIHIQNVHLLVSSPVTGGLSPLLRIAYSKPFIKIATQIQTGVRHNMLNEYFMTDIPLKYRTPIPDETLRVSVDFDTELDIYDHSIALFFSYKDWHHRLVAGDDFQISHINETQEINSHLRIRNQLSSGLLDISNVCTISYNWSDSTINFLPEYALIDTLGLHLGLFEISADIRYVSKRAGIEKMLSRYYIISTDFGIRVYCFKPYISVHNITDETSEIFDDYFLTGRQYAGGLYVEGRF